MSKKIKLLIVHNQTIISDNKKEKLKKIGYKILFASNKSEVIELYKKKLKFDIVLLEINSNKSYDSFDVADTILSRKLVPILFLLNNSSFDFIDKLQNIIFYGYIFKNTSVSIIHSTIQLALKLFRENQKSIENEKMYQKLFENINGSVFVSEADTGMIIDANSYAQDFIGYNLEKLKTMHHSELHPPELKNEAIEFFNQCFTTKFSRYEFVVQTADGRKIPVIIRSSGSFKINNKNVNLGIFYDISDRKKDQKKINSLLEEKEMLLNETHHRIKNNMGVIRSILSLEASMLEKHPDCSEVLNSCSNRVMSMMTLYEFLYRNQIKHEISIKYYLEELINKLVKVHNNINLKTNIKIDDILIKSSTVSSIGIIINELFTNSVKHAFKKFSQNKDRIISIFLNKINDLVTIVFSDNGVGLSDSNSFENSESFGLQLINMLVAQINGTIKTERKSGTQYIITMKIFKN